MAIVEEKPKVPQEPPPLRVVVLLFVLAAVGVGAWQLLSKETSASAAKSDQVPV